MTAEESSKAEPAEAPDETAVEATAEEETVGTEMTQESAEVIAEPEITETETVEEYQAGTSDFRYSENTADGSVTITGYTGTDSDVVIPSEINGKTVTAVGERVFVSNSCRSVTIPDTVTSIGVAAFSECGSLETVTLPQGLTRIEAQVFYKCSSLQNITIPESVTEIGVAAFSGCSGLLTMVIPNGVTSIGNNAFKDCTYLQSIVIPDSVTSIGSSAFSSCISLQDITIPASVTIIGNEVFNTCSSLQSVTVPNGVTYIGLRAFSSCSALQSITIPESVTDIGDYAFRGCTSLSDVYYQGTQSQWDSITIGTDNDPLNTATIHTAGEDTVEFDYTVNEDDTITITCYTGTDTVVVIPSAINGMTVTRIENLDSVGEGVFGESLEAVTLPDTLTAIGDYAFRDCTNLRSITIPDNVTTIGSNAFSGCVGLQTMIVPAGLISTGGNAVNGCESLETAGPIGSNANIQFGGITEVTQAYGRLFKYVTSIELPAGITGIGANAFSATSLSEITIPEGVTFIGNNAFKNCTRLQSVTLPESLTSIGNWAFDTCTSLQSITIPDSVTSIGTAAFYMCTSLDSVTLSSSLTAIPESLFKACSSLQSIVVPDNVAMIGNEAFRGCTGLENITVPVSVTSISDKAFADCSNLSDVYYQGTRSQWNEIVIGTDNDPLNTAVIHTTGEEPNVFHVTFNANGGTFYEGTENATTDDQLVQVTEGESVSEQIPELSLDGELPVGYTKDEETIVLTEDEVITFVPEKDTVFTAVWDQPVYTWEETEEGYTVTAYFENLPGNEERADAVLIESVPATCETDGSKHYSVQFSNVLYTEQTKDIEIPLIGHDYEVTGYSWVETETGYTVTASAVCKHDESHILTETAQAGYQVITEPACETEGLGRYTAVFENEHLASQTKDVVIPAIGHNYEFKEFIWSGDDETGYTAEGSYVCANDADHRQTIAAEITSETTDPACEEAGQTVYTAVIPAVASADEQEHTETKTVVIEALGHDYGGAEYIWTETETGYTVTASAVCKHDESHILAETAQAGYQVITEPACETEGLGRYTAVFEDEHFTEQIKDVEIPASGHNYEFKEFVWSGDDETGYTAEGSYVCVNDADHRQTIAAEITSETTDPACEEAGKTVYTAVIPAVSSADEQEHTETKTVVIEALGHHYGEAEYTWTETETGYSVTASAVCRNDESHILTETVAAAYEVITEPAYGKEGLGRYTAVFEDEHFTEQTKDVEIPAEERGTGLYLVDGTWQYYENGVFTEATGLVQRPDNKKWFYVKDGIYTKATGLTQRVDNGKWYYVQNGAYTKVTGVVRRIDNGKWFYVKDGVYTKATGLAQRPDNKQWYYVRNGAYYNKITGLVQRIDNSKWFYVENGVYKKVTGLVQRPDNKKWYYVANGAYTKATGLTQRVDNKKWYYVYNGAYTKWTGVTGRITDGKMFYVANGVYTKYTGTAKDAAGNTYKVTNGAAVRI